MNPDKPSREQIEARITALLLGELPAEEAELLRWTISQDAELQKLHNRLKIAIGLVRETVAHPAETSAEKNIPRKLSDERRQKLLAHFKTPRPKESFWLKQIQIPSLIPGLVAVALIAVLAAMLLPSLAAAKRKGQRATTMSMASSLSDKNEPSSEGEVINNPTRSLATHQPVRAMLLSPASTLAPPSAEIVLPQTEAAPAAGSVNSATVAGYANVQNNFGISSPADSFATGNGVSGGGGMGGAGGGGGGGRGGLYFSTSGGTSDGVTATAPPPAIEAQDKLVQVEQQWSPKVGVGLPVPGPTVSTAPATPNSSTALGWHGGALLGPVPSSTATFAFDDSGVNRSGAEGRAMPAEKPSPYFNFPSEGGVASPVPEKKYADSTVQRNLGVVSADRKLWPVVSSTEGFYDDTFLTSEPSQKTAENQSEKVPVLGDMPVTGNLFQSRTAFVAGEFANPKGAFPGNAPVNAAEMLAPAATPPAAGDRLAFSGEGELSKSGNGTLALNGNNSFAGGTTVSDGTIAGGSASPSQQRATDIKFVVTGFNFNGVQANSETKAANRGGAIPGTGLVNSFDTPVPTAMPAAPPATTDRFEFSGGGELSKSGSGALVLNGNNSFAGRTTGSGGTISGAIVPAQTVNNGTLALDDTITTGGRAGSIGANPNMTKAENRLIQNGGEIAMNYAQPSDVSKSLQELQTTNGFVAANGTVPVYNVYNGATRDDGNGLRNLLSTNAVALAGSSQQKSVKAGGVNYLTTPNRLPSAEPVDEDKAVPAQLPPPIPQPEIQTRDNAFSTFSLNVSDVSFKLAAASLEKGRMPDAASIRSEEFINAFNYRDPEAAAGQPLAFASERAQDPFAQNRDLLRFSVKTAAAGRPAGRPLNLVLLLDTSGSMERADRVEIIREALRVLAAQLQPQDTISIVTFARTARLWADGVPGDKAGETLEKVGGITPEGGTNLEEAMRLAYETARRHYLANGMNRVVLLTDGAANLGNVDPGALKQKVEAQRRQGIALDCFGIGWEDYNDDLLEELSGNGDGRYAFINTPDEAGTEFAAKLAGALQVAAQDVKVQVEFNPQRVVAWRQIGYAKHQLTKEQFRDNSVAAAAIAAQEAGNALYTVETKPDGAGPIATVFVRYRIPGTQDVRERSWAVDYTGNAPALEQSNAAMRLAAVAAEFSEWLAGSPFAQEVTTDELLKDLSGVPAIYGADPRPKQLEWMIRQARSVSGK